MTFPCDYRKLGHCPLTGKPLFEIVKTFPSGPLEGDPMIVGRPLECAVLVFLLLVSGSYTTVTMHRDAVPTLHERLPEVHKILCATNAHEEWARYVRSGIARSEPEMQRLREEWRRYYNDPPIGVLRVRQMEVSDA